MKCPRCFSGDGDIGVRTCRACRIAYDVDKVFEEGTREHTMVRARWVKWRSRDRVANERKRVEEFLGNA